MTDLMARRIKDAIMLIIGPTGEEFTLPVYITDVGGRSYSADLTWSYGTDPTALVTGKLPYPELGPPELFSTKSRERIREVSVASLASLL